ncbi:MAG TPA: glycosyltransferase family A protein [Terracidiphilus sp.]|nr:glycosyltransferase family A protein [Terracidiphilus sp.]
MEISVVVPTYNRREIVTRTLRSLFAQELAPARFEIIVVVDGSTDGTAEALRGMRPACIFRVIEQENRGLAGARNTGYHASQADLVLFLDDDMVCDPHLVEEHIAGHENRENTVVYGAIFLSNDSPNTLAAECFNREIGALHLTQDRTPGSEWLRTECIFGNTSIPRQILERLGGFDEAFRMREDLELGIRLFDAGAQAHYAGTAIARQYYGKTASDLVKDAEAFAISDAMLADKHPDVIIQGHVAWLRRSKGSRRVWSRIAGASQALGDFVLAPLCNVGEAFPRASWLRNGGVRALQWRRRIHWLHKLEELGAIRPGSNRKS